MFELKQYMMYILKLIHLFFIKHLKQKLKQLLIIVMKTLIY